MAVLLELRRALRKDPQADVSGIADRWRADLERRRAAGDSVSWLAYLSGGLAEVDQLLAPRLTPDRAAAALRFAAINIRMVKMIRKGHS